MDRGARSRVPRSRPSVPAGRCRRPRSRPHREPDRPRPRWKPFRQAQERIEKAAGAHAKARQDLAPLEAQLGAAERNDELALSRALLDGKDEPTPTAAKVRGEISAQQRRVKALKRAYGEAQAELGATIEDNRSAWSREAIRETSRARTRYESALAELEAARGNLSAAVGLSGWVSSGGAAHRGARYQRTRRRRPQLRRSARRTPRRS